MPYPKPINPQWPDKDAAVEFPLTRKLPLVNKNDNTGKQIWDWLTKRSKYLLVKDDFVYIPMLNAWSFIPRNFVYDNASIPRVFGFVLRPDGILSYGALPHDFGYRFGGLMLSAGPAYPYQFVELSKKTIDQVFKDLNNRVSNLKVVNAAAEWAVDTFAPWNPTDIEKIDWTKPVSRDYYVLV